MMLFFHRDLATLVTLVMMSLATGFTPCYTARRTAIMVPNQSRLAMVRIPFLQRGNKDDSPALEDPEKAPVVDQQQQQKKQGESSTVSTYQQEFMEPVSLPEEEDNDDTKKTDVENMMQQVKDSGVAGVVSYALWELAFWAVSVPVCIIGYQQVTGHWPDLNDKEDIAKLSAEAFAFVNFARFAVPLRIGLALSTTPWIQENIIDNFKKDTDTSMESNDETQ